MIENSESVEKIKRLEDKHREAELKHQNILSEMKAEKEKYLKSQNYLGEVKAFGVVQTSPKIPVWLATIVISGLIVLFIYIANKPAQ